MALPLIPILILGGGAVLLFAAKKSGSSKGGGTSCDTVFVTQKLVDSKEQQVLQWAMKWRDQQGALAIDVAVGLMAILFPNCEWPPVGDRTIIGADGKPMKWSQIEAMLAGKTLKDVGEFRFGEMAAADATGMSAHVGPGFGGIV